VSTGILSKNDVMNAISFLQAAGEFPKMHIGGVVVAGSLTGELTRKDPMGSWIFLKLSGIF